MFVDVSAVWRLCLGVGFGVLLVGGLLLVWVAIDDTRYGLLAVYWFVGCCCGLFWMFGVGRDVLCLWD